MADGALSGCALRNPENNEPEDPALPKFGPDRSPTNPWPTQDSETVCKVTVAGNGALLETG